MATKKKPVKKKPVAKKKKRTKKEVINGAYSKKPLMIPIGERIKLAREQHGWSRKEFAAMLGTSNQSLQQIEDGIRVTSIPRVYDVAKVLCVSPEWILTGINVKSIRAKLKEADAVLSGA